MNAALALASALALAYAALVLRYWRALPKRPPAPPAALDPPPRVSLLVAFRDEAANLPQLLDDLLAQDYPRDRWEVWLVDDHSQDDSPQIARNWAGKGLEINVLENPGQGKKSALAAARQHATGQLWLQTDADCRLGPGWVSSMAAAWRPGVAMLLGPVALEPSRGLGQCLQALEFASLLASTAASACAGQPILCNGANLAYDAQAWRQLRPDDRPDLASGDDMFLLQAFKKAQPGGIRFVLDARALARTRPQPTLRAFFDQRTRWTSKSRGYTDPWIVGVALLVLLVNLALLGLALGGFVHPRLWWAVLLLLLVKSLADRLLLGRYLALFGMGRLLRCFMPTQLLYPLYVGLVGLLGQFRPVNWKGRRGR